MTIWYIFPVLVSCTKKNLATLVSQAGSAICPSEDFYLGPFPDFAAFHVS
jgi:hypothetical protein